MTEYRAARANKLLEKLKHGPHWCDIGPKPGRLDKEDAEEATRQYQLWAQSWIIGEIMELIPELKG